MALLELHYVGHQGQEVSYTINKGKKVYTRKTKSDGSFTQDGMPYQFIKSDKKINLLDSAFKAQDAQPLKPLQSEFSINKRFSFLEKFTNMVLDGETASAIVTGEGGLGKSHTVMQELERRGWEEEIDYIVVKGYATPKALYGTLWEHSKKTVIFDDCDSVLKDPTAVNILKGALDSYDKRTISWLQKGFIDDGLPNSFEFQGNVIFISNMSSDKLDQAVKSRSMTIDLSMTIEDKIERMSHILKDILPGYDLSMKQEVLEFMAAHAEEAVEFNVRTLQKLIKTCHAYDNEPEWKEAGKYLLTSN
jgi:Cdc6-like AAA superfamily ATPase